MESVVADFVFCLAAYPHDKWTKYLHDVSYSGLHGKVDVPLLIVTCGGHVTPPKLALINKALVDWQAITKSKILNKINGNDISHHRKISDYGHFSE